MKNQKINRILNIISYYELKDGEFAFKIGVVPQKIAYMKSANSVSSEILEKILFTFPKLNANWLIRGEGSMFLDSSEQPKQSASVEVSNYNSKIEQQQDYGGGRKAEDLIIKEKDARLAEKERHIAEKERYIRILERQLARYEQADSLSN